MTDSISPRRNPLGTAPNLLTVIRICLAPFLVAAILENRFGLASLFLSPPALPMLSTDYWLVF